MPYVPPETKSTKQRGERNSDSNTVNLRNGDTSKFEIQTGDIKTPPPP